MAAWPELDELKQYLDVTSDEWDGTDVPITRLSRALAAAINRVKGDVGQWDEVADTPDDRLAQAAFRAAVVIASTDEGLAGLSKDTKYQTLLKGKRRRFGIA